MEGNLFAQGDYFVALGMNFSLVLNRNNLGKP